MSVSNYSRKKKKVLKKKSVSQRLHVELRGVGYGVVIEVYCFQCKSAVSIENLSLERFSLDRWPRVNTFFVELLAIM